MVFAISWLNKMLNYMIKTCRKGLFLHRDLISQAAGWRISLRVPENRARFCPSPNDDLIRFSSSVCRGTFRLINCQCPTWTFLLLDAAAHHRGGFCHLCKPANPLLQGFTLIDGRSDWMKEWLCRFPLLHTAAKPVFDQPFKTCRIASAQAWPTRTRAVVSN